MKKIKSKTGFTLVEMLACVVTLLLLGMIVTTGMNLASASLRETTFESNSQMLEDTLDMYIGDILRHATKVEVDEEGVHFNNDVYYIDKGSFVVDTSMSGITDAGYLVCTSSYDEDSSGTLVASKGVYAGNLYIKDFQISYNEEKGVFSGRYIIVSNLVDTTKTCEFSYKTIAK